jgi:hypothetical protein
MLAVALVLSLLAIDGRAVAVAKKKAASSKKAAPAVREVAGLRPGMTLEEVRAVLAAHQPPFPPPDERVGEMRRLPGLKFVPDVSSNLSGASLKSSGAQTVTAYLTPPPIPSRVFGVESDVRHAPEARLTPAALKQTLERIYGKAPFSTPPAKPNDGEGKWSWSWQPDGSAARSDPSACRKAFDQMTSGGIWWNEIGAAPPTIPADCGTFIEARYEVTPESKGLVERLRLALFDMQALRGASFAAHDEARKRPPAPGR